MNLYDVTVVITVEAENHDEAIDFIDDLLGDPYLDYDIQTIHKLPLVREDSP